MTPHRSSAPRQSPWRAVCAIALCALAGAGLRRSLSASHTASPAAPRDPSTTAAHQSPSPPRRLTPESLSSFSALDRLAALAARLPDMTVAEIAPLVKSLAATCPEDGGLSLYGSINDSPTAALLQALFTRWAELDAPGMMAALHGSDFRYSINVRRLAVTAWAELRGTIALESVAQDWPGLATRAAWDMIQRQPGRCAELLPWLRGVEDFPLLFPSDSDALRMKMPPEDFVKLAMALGKEGYVWSSLEDLSRTDPQRALRIAKSLPPGRYRDSALDTLMRDTPYDAFINAGLTFRHEFEALPAGTRTFVKYAYDYAKILTEENPENALAWARSLTDTAARSHALGSIAVYLPAGTPAADRTRLSAEAWLADPAEADHVPADTFKEWHTADPATAEAWLAKVPHPGLRATLAQALEDPAANGWTGLSSSSARLDYVRDSLFPDEQKKAQAAKKDVPALLSPENVPDDLLHMAELSAAARAGVKDEVWAASNSEDRRFLSAEAMKTRVETSSVEAAMKLFNSMAPEERSLGAWYEAGRAKVIESPAAASEWVNSLPPGPERDAATTALVENLSGEEWFYGAWPGPANPFAPHLDAPAKRDGAAAFALAATMRGEAEREQSMSQAAEVWALKDPAAARAAVAAANLPDSTKQTLLTHLPKGGAQ